ncbi:MAG: VWA domain-containing protein [Granulosicoccus sp.]
MIELNQRLHDFAEFLRANGMPVDPGTVVQFQTLAAMGYAQSRSRLLVSTRSCTCVKPADWKRYDALFNTFWQPDGVLVDASGDSIDHSSDQSLNMAGEQRLLGIGGTSEKQRQEEELFGAGDFKALSLADFRFVFDHRQMLEIELLVERLARRARKRFSRREYSSTRGHAIDVRRSMRQSLRYCGQPMDLRFKRKRQRLHRFVLLLDISQSMDVYARLFLRFSRIFMTVFQRSDAFVFNTELNELAQGYSRLAEADFERVLNAFGKGWLGGTRIAQSLESFNELHLKRRVDSRTVVVIFSDGCDTDPPERLAQAVATIQRRAGKLVWVNPLLGRFEPGEVDRYMDPVAPFTDTYCSAHNLESLIALERELTSR